MIARQERHEREDEARLFDNILWHALTGAQAAFAEGSGAVRRYARGFSPIVACADPEQPDFATLTHYCDGGEALYFSGWSGSAPSGWRIEAETTMFRMVYRGGDVADEADDAVPLGATQAQAALELARLTRPGPFGPRTIELGEYFGIFAQGRLVAMAGERMCAGRLREISGVCTHPDHAGRGLARRLLTRLIARERARGEIPFLHVLRDNTGARRLYERLGFEIQAETVVRVTSAPARR